MNSLPYHRRSPAARPVTCGQPVAVVDLSDVRILRADNIVTEAGGGSVCARSLTDEN